MDDRSKDIWIHEKLYPGYRQSFKLKKMICEKQTKFQHVTLFESESHGKVLMLDHVVQLTERDEYIYHEMLVHVPMMSHPLPRRVLIVGGGDGGAAHRALMYKGVEITLVEIDQEITELAREHLAGVSNGAFDDTRLTIIYEDGAKYVAETHETFDVIITDRGDPIGPVTGLFFQNYYRDCKKCLNGDGIFVALNGVPFMQPAESAEANKILNQLFRYSTCFYIDVPTYVGGRTEIGWSSNSCPAIESSSPEYLRKLSKLNARYYSPTIHHRSFR